MISYACVLLTLSLQGATPLKPARLRCEYLVDPIGIGETVPRLSWIDESKARGARQTAYQIRVASSTEKLKSPDLWDSGKRPSDDSVNIAYAGQRLRSRDKAWWTVRVWDVNGKPSPYCKPAKFEIGLLDNSEWKAQWIGQPNPVQDIENLDKVKWIWYPEGVPAKEAPAGDRLFQAKFDVPAKSVKYALLRLAVDNSATASINGFEIARSESWRAFTTVHVEKVLKPGQNEVTILAHNSDGPAGVAALLRIGFDDGTSQVLHTDANWKASDKGGATDWSHTPDSLVVADIGKGPWGVPAQSPPATPAPYLRKPFQVTKKVRSARLYASAKGLYFAEIDGQRIGRDIFTPGWTDYHKRIQYQAYDVTDRLQPGDHAIGLVLGDGWYCGHVGWSGRGQYGPRPLGLAQLEIEYDDGSRETIATDASWKAATGPILENDMLMGESYDARQELTSWSSAAFDDRTWALAQAEPLADVPLVAHCAPTVQAWDELKPKSVKEPKPGVFVFDLGQNLVGWARLRVSGGTGQTVQLRFAEMLNPDGTIYTTNLRGAKNTDRYTLKGRKDEVWQPDFTFHGFRYVEVTGYPGKPSIDAVTGVAVGSATDQSGAFECSSPMVNQLQHNIYWGQRGNYLEVPTDCPQRDERLGWMGDAQIFARTATYNCDVAAFMTKWVQDIRDAQSPEGGYTDVTPRIVDLSDGAPAWGDAGVIVPWTMYLAYGDRRMLERHYESAQKWIEYIRSVNPDLLWVKRSNNNFGDWLNIDADMPRDVLATAYFAYSTRIVGRMAAVLGKPGGAAKYEALFGNIRAAFNQAFVSSDGKIKGDTQTCYVLALRFDLLPPELRQAATQRLVDNIRSRDWHLSTGFVGVGYLCPTLTAIGHPEVAYKLLNNDTFPSWGYSIKHGATTIWERWDGWTAEKGFQDPGMNSFNHYSLGSVGEWLFETVAGIGLDPDEPGYRHVVIRPQPGGSLTWAKATYRSIRGDIASSWKIAGPTVNLDVTIPANTRATVYIPANGEASVLESGKPAGQAEGVKFERMEGGFAVFQVGSGRYRFSSKISPTPSGTPRS